MLKNLVAKLTGSALEPISKLGELRAGRVLLEGTIRAETAVFSPIKQRECAGFYYRSTYQVTSRIKGYIRQKLRDALVYGEGLSLGLDGGAVSLTPKRNDSFGADEHADLSTSGIDGFQAWEKLCKQGASVKATGRARLDGERWVLVFEQLEFDEPAPKKARKTGGQRKKQRKRRR